MHHKSIAAVVLAGGRGSRMNSDLPKVLHRVGDKPMILRILDKLKSAGIAQFFVVLGFKAEEVKKVVSGHTKKVDFAFQERPMGTNHALEAALENPHIKDFDHLLVINGDDAALYKDQTLEEFFRSHTEQNASISMITLNVSAENALGRVMRDQNNEFDRIMEAFEYVKSDQKSTEINCGVYLFDTQWVVANIKKVELNGKGEYPITDLLNIAKAENKKVNLYLLKDANEWAGVNTIEELNYANSIAKQL